MGHRLAVLAALAAASLAAGSAPATAATDPLASLQWNLDKVAAPAAWGAGTGEGVTIAVVDSGVVLDHEDLAGKLDLSAARDWVDGDTVPQDEEGHGTHVAGIAAATTANGRGVAGVAPDARIMPLRVLDADGEGSPVDVEEAIDWAVDHGADVINLSLSEPGAIRVVLGSSIEPAVNRAWERGVICVIAAGNELGLLPSGYGSVNAIVVSATTRDDTKPDFSNGVSGARWGIAAPGGGDTVGSVDDDVLSTYRDRPRTAAEEDYAYLRGTSMSAPHVAGAAAILRGLGLSPQQTVDRLLSSADDVGPPGRDATFGSGRLNVARAVAGLGAGAPPAGGTAGPGAVGAPTPVPGPGAASGPVAGPGPNAPSGAGRQPARPPVVAGGTVAPQASPELAPGAVPPPADGDVPVGRARPPGPDADDDVDPLPVALALAGVAATGAGVNLVARRRQRHTTV